MQPGIREALITDALEAELADVGDPALVRRRPLPAAEAADRIALHVARTLESVIATRADDERAGFGLALARRIVELLGTASPADADEILAERPTLADEPLLLGLAERRPDGTPAAVTPPITPLLDTALLTNAHGEPALVRQLQTEIASCRGIDIVMAFVRYSGIRPLLEYLARHRAENRPVRLLTTTYTGSTEARALDALADLGVDIRVSYEVGGTRLHAKAWLFHRPDGLATAYVGSSNLTHSAQVTGLEWNVRIAEARNRAVIDKMRLVFDSYWTNPDFEPYERVTFLARVAATRRDGTAEFLLPTEIRLEPFQERLLEQVEFARHQGRHRNLLVAATGTGKTVMAAVDYERLRARLPRARLLFVAHRRELLAQAIATFRQALRQPAFGESWVDGMRPTDFEHVFASIQSLDATGYANLEPAHFDVVIVDEFHHAAADSYARLLAHVRPRELLGLTATPERADGRDVLGFFDGGRITAELRLWDAIDQQRLTPFVYYGIHDDMDLTQVPFRRGRGYDVERLTALLTADDIVARRVAIELERHVADVQGIRALGFCVSVAHAEFMADRFRSYGIPAAAVHAGTPEAGRDDALRSLADGALRVVFSVDLLNEGIDVPLVDTLLLLRPTESATVFMQQLGRGLRRHPRKSVCTVLDFVGHHRAEFRFDLKYRALLGLTRRELRKALDEEFPFLPAGCHFALDRKARSTVLDSLRNAVPSTWAPMRRELAALGECTLAQFLAECGLGIAEFYGARADASWSALREAAGLPCLPAGPAEAALRRGIGRLVHIDDELRIDAYLRFLAQPGSNPETLPLRERRLLRMLLATLIDKIPLADVSLAGGLAFLGQHPQVLAELNELLPLLRGNLSRLCAQDPALPDVPLAVHARYRRREILAACGAGDERQVQPPTWREGVRFEPAVDADLFVVTIRKSDRFSPTTRYRDYAISRDLFHWESQSMTRAGSPTGLRYQQHAERGSGVLLFTRENEDAPFCFLGRIRYLRHESERPMRITWRLEQPLPGDLYAAFAAQA